MLKYTIERSTSRRWQLAAAAALALILAVVSPSPGQQGPADAVPAADLLSNADLDAAAGDMAVTQDEMRQLQETLRDLGYFSGPADGRRGPRTREALRDFQMDQGLPTTGSLDTTTVTRIGMQASMVGVPNQPPDDVLRRADDEIAAASAPDAEATLPEAVTGDPAAVPTDPPAVPVDSSVPPPPAETRSRKSGMKDGVEQVGDVVVDAGGATLKGASVGGKATVDGVSTAGKSTAKAGVVSGKAVATGATKTVDGTLYVGKSIKNGTVYVASKTRDLFVGDKGTSREDEQIRQSLLSQFAGDDRLIASEIDVKVSKGHVTLAVPEGARSDMNQASRLARITPGVKTVTTVFTSVQEQAVVEPAPSPTVPAESPIVDPEMAPPPIPVETSGPEDQGEL